MPDFFKPAPKDRNDFLISPLKLTELEELSQLSKVTYEESFPGYYSKEQLDMLFSYPEIFKHFNHPNHFYLVAKKQGEIIGYAKLIYEDNNHSVFLDKLYLLKKYQKLGFGKNLIHACYQHAVNKNNQIMQLEVWEKNENAINFYRKCGFVATKKIPYIYPDGKQSTNGMEWLMICHDISKQLTKMEALEHEELCKAHSLLLRT
jgi:ribosomal protein S18 acetylase RimI-like enzyme